MAFTTQYIYCLFFLLRFSFTNTDDSQENWGREGIIFCYSALPLASTHEHSDIFCNFACDMTITYSDRTACIYQTATRCLFTWWFDPRLLLQHLGRGNRWTRTRIDYHPCITPSRLTKGASHPVSTVNYFIPYLSVLDQRRIQNFVRHLTYSFLQKLFTALCS